MRHHSFSAKVLVVPLLLALAVMVWLVLREDPHAITSEDGAAVAALGNAQSAALESNAEYQEESVAAPELQRVDLELGVVEVGDAEANPRQVQVRAELTIVENQQGHPPTDCEGWIVTAQSWIEDTGETTRYTGVSNRRGIAEFHFPDFVHIDWVTCLPPQESGYGIAIMEEHEDINAGDRHLALLPLSPARKAFGHVVDWNDQPVGGVEVHAFSDYGGNGPNSWVDGLLTTTTNSAGRFEFSQLIAGEWTFSVLPQRWLMYEPLMNEQVYQSGAVWLEDPASTDMDAGILRVMPMTTVELTVVDQRGVPVNGASGVISPLMFDSPRLYPPSLYGETDEPMATSMQGFAAAEEDFFAWPYEQHWFRTFTNGQSTLRLAPGLWELRVDELDGYMLDVDDLPSIKFNTNVGQVSYALPIAFGEVQARILHEDGTPVKLARLTLRREGADRYIAKVYSGSNGDFIFPNLELDANYTMRATSNPDWNHFEAEEWPFHAATANGQDYVVEPAVAMSVLLKRTDAPSFQGVGAVVRVSSWRGSKGAALNTSSIWWQNASKWRSTVFDGEALKLPSMPPGAVTLELLLPQGIGEWNLHGLPKVKNAVFTSWQVEVQRGCTYLEVDLSSYAPPAPRQAVHFGEVVNAHNGQAIQGAGLTFAFTKGSLRTATDSDGHFQIATAAIPATIMVHAVGYLPSKQEGLDFQVGRRQFRVELEPINRAFVLVIQDRQGATMPSCSVDLFDAKGTPLAANNVDHYFGQENTMPLWANDGSVRISDVTPGPARAKILFDDQVEASGWFEAPSSATDRVEVRLNKTLAEILEELAN